MFNLFEIINNRKIEIIIDDGLYSVHELGMYQIEYYSTKIASDLVFLEDEAIPSYCILEANESKIVTIPFKFFENYFGFANVEINKENFQFNILGEKFELKEIEEILLYLFEKNHLIITKFVSKSSLGISSVYDGKDYVYSSKYLQFISTFSDLFEEEYDSFKNRPHTLIRKKFRLADYNNQVIDFKSVEWILQNLDIVSFDQAYSEHPEAIFISKNYGIVDKIGAEENSISYNTYENQIILGSFKFIESKLSEIKQLIKRKLPKKGYTELTENSQYTDFRDLQTIPFLRLLNEIDILETRIKKITIRYSRIFANTEFKNKFPKLTPVFHKLRHYQSAFNQIRLLRKIEYSLDSQIQLLNIRKLSDLYELYNLNVLIEIIDEYFSYKNFSRKVMQKQKNLSPSSVSYSSIDNNFRLNLFYEPTINNDSKDVDLITIGNSELIGKYCKPDFILEVCKEKEKFYCILDSKYSKIRTIREHHLPTCIRKYIIDVGMRNDPFKKTNFLVLLHPDSRGSEVDLIYSKAHFPKIKTIVSKPNSLELLKTLIYNFIEDHK